MRSDDQLLDLDYLVFSAHKTATQTVTSTLRKNNFNSAHCHILRNIGIEEGNFKDFLERYYLVNKKPLNIISVFREPMERFISSFFQYYGEGVIIWKKVHNTTDTIIYKSRIDELQEKLIGEISSPPVERGVQFAESIEHICNELKIDVKDLGYSPQTQYGLYEADAFRVFTFRFDIFTKNFEHLLSTITETPIKQYNANMSKTKWYYPVYREFMASLRVPQATIINVYESRCELIDLFYPDEYDGLLKAALDRYGK